MSITSIVTNRRVWIFTLAYTLLSVLAEIFMVLLLGFDLKQDTTTIALVLFVGVPLLSAFIAEHKKAKPLITLLLLSALGTLFLHILLDTLSISNIHPVFVRFIAGLFAAMTTERLRH